MNKLTAEVARRNIQFLKEMQSAPRIGLSMRSELFLQALEIALPILEQQEMITDSLPVITDSEEMITDSVERESFEDWFKGAMHLGGRCFVDKPTKRRMWRAWQAATYRQPERATNQNGEQ